LDNVDAVQESLVAEENAGTKLLRMKEIQKRLTIPHSTNPFQSQ
jgi:hypothetical protein